MSSRDVVDRLMLDVAHEVDRLPPIVRRQMAPVLAQARHETAQGLSRWLQTAENGKQRFTAQQYRRVLAQLDQAFDTIATLEPHTYDGLIKANEYAIPLARQHIIRELETFAAHFKDTLIPLPFREASTIVDGSTTLMRRFASSAARYAGEVGNDIRRELAVGLMRGESVGQMAARLVRHTPRGKLVVESLESAPGAVSNEIAGGLFTRYTYWADRLARTEVINAYNVHADEGIALAHTADPRIERMWSAVADRRECPTCSYLDGKIAPVGGLFPEGYESPPAHPYCRCTTVAWRSDWS